ncbi:MAG: apolipoprotein N-acyltransferase [Burkholderiales bacterium]|nr:apolipoprotein N-acyltransferase [Burkholderiales bacterium]
MPSLVPTLLAAALGLAHALSFAPWNLPWLQVLALAGLFALAPHARSIWHAALLGFAFGLGWFGLGVSWVYISMHTYGGMPALLAGLATATFCAFLAIYPALALALAHRVALPARLALALPALWTGSEWLRGWLFTGFPWLASGYAHSDGPLAGLAPVLGVYGATLAAALLAGALALALHLRAARRAVVLAGLGALLLLAAGQVLRGVQWTQPDGAPISVRLVQGNMPQDMKFSEQGLQRAVEVHSRLLDGPRVDLAVLPESVFPIPLNYLPDHVTQTLLGFVRGQDSALVFGVFIEDPPGSYYNSAVGLRPDAGTAGAPPLQRYSKRHLVPFGEFIPWGFRWFVDLMRMPIGDQRRGAPYQGPMDLAGQRIAVNICYEDLFGREIISAWQVPDRAPTLLLNISNLAWFDDSIALDQHLQISRLRALETGRPMLRATNTGATAVIDARGAVTQVLPYRTEGALNAEVTGYAGTTPYVRWGDWPALIATGLVLLAGLLLGRRR